MMNNVLKAKRALIKELIALVKPKLHKSGYPGVMLACFKDKSGYRTYKVKGYTLDSIGGGHRRRTHH